MVLGSGGHTTEMVALARALDRQVYTPRTYIIAQTDTLSKIKIEKEESGRDDDVRLITIPRQYSSSNKIFLTFTNFSFRSREVGQSYISSIATTVYAFIGSFQPIFRRQPQLLLVNGPGMETINHYSVQGSPWKVTCSLALSLDIFLLFPKLPAPSWAWSINASDLYFCSTIRGADWDGKDFKILTIKLMVFSVRYLPTSNTDRVVVISQRDLSL